MRTIRKILPLAVLIPCALQAASDNPLYVGARVGGVTFDSMETPLSDRLFDDQDVGGGVFVGYKFIDWFGLEAGYTTLGEADFKAGGGGFEVEGADLVGKFTWPIQPSFDLFAKAGAYWFNADNTVFGVRDDDNDVAATAGVGAEYYFNSDWSVRAEYQYYDDVGSNKTGSSNIHFYGLSLVYGWGAPAPVIAAPVVAAVVAEPKPEPKPAPAPKPAPKVMIEEVSANLPFNFDSDQLTQQDIDALQPVGDQLVKYPDTKLYVVGHTDSRGTEEYNQTLSEQRAASVVSYLQDFFGIERDRIVVEGRGELDPVASNDTDLGRAENRRVEVFVPAFEIVQK